MSKSSHNFDQEEINKFANLADKWWDLNGEFKPLHDINPLRLKFIQDHIDLKEKDLIDVGCGGGILSESLAKAGANVTGIDLAQESIEVAKAHAEKNSININYLCQDVEEYAEENPGKFDILTCMELLEHVPAPDRMVQTCAKLVKPGGKLFFSTINRTWKAYLKAIIGAEYILGMIPIGTHDYSKLIKPSELEAWSRIAGIKWEKILGLTYNPLTNTYSTTPNLDTNYMVSATKLSK